MKLAQRMLEVIGKGLAADLQALIVFHILDLRNTYVVWMEGNQQNKCKASAARRKSR
jgi:hypothetical protein